jgi:hypothetical protein
LSSIKALLKNYVPKFAPLAIGLLLAGAVAGDASVVRDRELLWKNEGEKARHVIDFLTSYQGPAVEGSQIGLIGFPASLIHMEDTIKYYLGINDATFIHPVDIALLEDPRILQNAEKSFLFIYGHDGHIYDRSQMYRRHLLLCRRAMANFNNKEHLKEAQAGTFELIDEINHIVRLYKASPAESMGSLWFRQVPKRVI